MSGKERIIDKIMANRAWQAKRGNWREVQRLEKIMTMITKGERNGGYEY